MFAAFYMVPYCAGAPMASVHAANDCKRFAYHSQFKKQRGERIFDSGPVGASLRIQISGRLRIFIRRICCVEHAAFRIEVMTQNGPGRLLDAFLFEQRTESCDCGEPLAAELVGHTAIVSLVAIRSEERR